jgi:cellulose synthase/poly-beta-1,6-N-acetylglucosamine synthase-like glycosyltransferase
MLNPSDRSSVPSNDADAMPFLSVIIPIYNGEADLPDLVPCLWNQDYPPHRVEYLLVDNNSGDRTFALLQEYAKQSREKTITLITLQEKDIQSSYAARNAGINASRGDVLVFTDADCRPSSQWLTELIAPFEDSSIGMVAGEIAGLPSQNWLETYAQRQDTLSQTHTLAHSFRPYGQTANLAIRRVALERIGLFRPYLTTGGDADLCWRIQQGTDWAIAFAENAMVYHRHRSTLADLRSQWRRYGRSNRYLHDLYGIALSPELSLAEYGKRLLRWFLKEVPIHTYSMLQKKCDWVDLLSTPISLICIHARSQGQRRAHLPDQAHRVEPCNSLTVTTGAANLTGFVNK